MQKCSETTNQEPESSLARLAKIFHIIKRGVGRDKSNY